MTKARRRGAKRGVALVLVLGAIAILTVMLTEFQDEATGEFAGALADRDALKAEYLARSGINLSRLLIAAEPTMRQAMSILFFGMRNVPQIPVWEFADQVLGAFNDSEGTAAFAVLTGTDLSLGKNLGIEGGRFEVTVVDEDAKLNVNLAARGDLITANRLAMELLSLTAPAQYSPMFEERDRDDQFSDRATVCGAIIDWADPDENLYPCDLRPAPSSQAAEDNFYQLLKTPFMRKNAAYDSLEELHLVRGVGDDYWATFVDPSPNNPAKRVMTVWGQGAVNVNTANAQTLLALVCSGSRTAKMCTDPEQAAKFLTLVSMLQGFTMGAPLFNSPQDFTRTLKGEGRLGPLVSTFFDKIVWDSELETQKAIATDSKMFSIYADGIVSGFRRKTRVRIHTVVDFRDAPAPGYPPLPPGGAGAGGTAGVPPPATTSTASGSGGQSQDAIKNFFLPNPGGTVIYFRIE